MNKERCLLVVSGPSGAGKDTIVKLMRSRCPEIEMSVSATTRMPRQGEKNGVHYYFLTKESFEKKIKQGEMLEYVNYCGHYYGTPRAEIDSRLARGIRVILNIEVVGAARLKSLYPQATLVFIKPPSIEELGRRLRGRGTESEQVIQQRLQRAAEEMQCEHEYDVSIVNETAQSCADNILELWQRRMSEG